jgi:hypothetical protein
MPFRACRWGEGDEKGAGVRFFLAVNKTGWTADGGAGVLGKGRSCTSVFRHVEERPGQRVRPNDIHTYIHIHYLHVLSMFNYICT